MNLKHCKLTTNLFALALLTLPALGLSQSLSHLKISPDSLVGGNSATGTVTISKAAPAAGFVVTLASDQSFAQVPASVTVAAGSNSATFAVTTTSVTVRSRAAITATGPNGKKETEHLDVTIAKSAIHEVSIKPEKVQAGNSATGTVQLEKAAPTGGLTVTLSSDQTFAQVPASVVVAAGAKSATFTVTTTSVTTNGIATITATDPTGAKRADSLLVTVQITLRTDHVEISPDDVLAGQSATGTIRLDGKASAAGFVVTLSSDQPFVQVPTTVTFGEGVGTAMFTVTTTAVTTTSKATVTVTDPSGKTHTASIRVEAPKVAHLEEMSLKPDEVVGGNSSTATVTIDKVAPAGGLTITLASDQTFAQVPATVTIAAGAKQATFTVTTSVVTTKGIAMITATDPSNHAVSHRLAVKLKK